MVSILSTSDLTDLLDLPEYFVVHSAYSYPSHLTLNISCTASEATCPCCQSLSGRVHGKYGRVLADLPCARQVTLLLTVRQFVCSNHRGCGKIFTERLAELTQSYARKTNRLMAALQAVGLASGGELGTRLSEKLGMSTTPPTLLRHVMALPLPPRPLVRVLGIDDFAWRKRFRYGTVLVDLEQRKIIDILPDRESATVEKWLAEHPEVEVISRDRGKEFTKAATQAAPQAQQVADRFHLLRNLTEVLQVVLSRCRSEVRRADDEPLPAETREQTVPLPLPTPQTWRQTTPPNAVKLHQARQTARSDCYQQMKALREEGLTQVEIAKRLNMAEKTVQRWLKAGAAPTWEWRARRSSPFDRYAEYVLQRWEEGIHEGKQLYEEIKAQGFKGTLRVVQRYIQTLVEYPEKKVLPPATSVEKFSANEMTWLLIKESDALTPDEKDAIDLACQRSPTIQKPSQLTKEFVRMLRQRQGQEFDQWVQLVEECQIPELRRFARNLLKDKDAVVAGLTLLHSNGPVEAQVQKLKAVKRQMFGRAKLPLLRQRLIHAV